MVVFQFVISIVLTIGTAVIYQQLSYVQQKDLGFNKTYTLVSPLFFVDRSLNKNVESIKQSFLQHPNVVAATASYNLMGWLNAREAVRPEGTTGSLLQMDMLRIDADFLNVYEIPIVQGRGFSKDLASDSTQAFLLNQTAVKQLGWSNPIGKHFHWRRHRGTVVGIVKDFHMRPLHEPIEPVALHITDPNNHNFLSVRIRAQNMPETLSFLQDQWQHFLPNRTFQFKFSDEKVAEFYILETKLSQFLGSLTLIAIFVASLGLFGLAAFTAQQRTKEIGVRKVLGASVSGIILLLSKDFVKLVAIATLIACPIAHMAMNHWLQTFAFRTTLSWHVFAISGLLTLSIALTTVGYHALKAARANPIDALRYE
ncbi:MAG: hypothetical protein HN521_08185 [Candidatus Latescibacteria bacterium]|nr:hypothetical protein [Candidatus Latescibacterota bacterium]